MQIFGLAGQASQSDSADFVSELGVDNIEHLFDETGEIWDRFGIATQPAWIFVNDNGEINTQLGGLGADGILQALEQLESS